MRERDRPSNYAIAVIIVVVVVVVVAITTTTTIVCPSLRLSSCSGRPSVDKRSCSATFAHARLAI
jgi:hypothetical protein